MPKIINVQHANRPCSRRYIAPIQTVTTSCLSASVKKPRAKDVDIARLKRPREKEARRLYHRYTSLRDVFVGALVLFNNFASLRFLSARFVRDVAITAPRDEMRLEFFLSSRGDKARAHVPSNERAEAEEQFTSRGKIFHT